MCSAAKHFRGVKKDTTIGEVCFLTDIRIVKKMEACATRVTDILIS